MSDDFIPHDVRDFIIRHIDSIAQLEALLLLKAHPRERWDARSMSKRLYIGEAEALATLARLCADDFVSVEDGAYRYCCADEAVRLTIARLAETYAKHLIPVTNMIHAKSSKIREFSDAFKLRKDP